MFAVITKPLGYAYGAGYVLEVLGDDYQSDDCIAFCHCIDTVAKYMEMYNKGDDIAGKYIKPLSYDACAIYRQGVKIKYVHLKTFHTLLEACLYSEKHYGD